MSKIRNEASRASFSPAVRRLADHLETQEHAVQFYDVIALGGMDKALDVEEMTKVLGAHRIECTGLEGVTCRACREAGWMSLHAFTKHQAEAMRASVLDVPAEVTR